MKQRPLLRRPPLQDSVAAEEAAPEYLRLEARDGLDGTHLFLAPGAVLDVCAEPHGGLGLGRIAYSPGLKAALKKGPSFTYRFTLPAQARRGDSFSVTAWGHDRLAQLRFVLEVA